MRVCRAAEMEMWMRMRVKVRVRVLVRGDTTPGEVTVLL